MQRAGKREALPHLCCLVRRDWDVDPLVEHRIVHACLDPEMQNAFEMVVSRTFSSAEWSESSTVSETEIAP
ncbi:hypothetical protein GCM10009087_19600 [Sphingomonas oligophenolica]|uniref:Uncharacterized protein n=1 Tax=Sphingomonas oligophenolica TaxID=301154 RepID=A0ABU9YB37_9SPHN